MSWNSRREPVIWIVVFTVVALVAAVATFTLSRGGGASLSFAPAGPASAAPAATGGELTYQRVAGPAGTVARNGRGAVVARFTDGARTVRITGRSRTFTEPAFTNASVTTDAWIRLAPVAWQPGAEKAGWFASWFRAALTDTRPDVLAVAMDYLHGAPARKDAAGVRYAGDAAFGPVSPDDPDGRAENSDFIDYLGVPWKFPDVGTVAPNRSRYGDVDCSGYLRLVYGYRMGYPLRRSNTPGVGLPRRAYAMSQFGPGVVVVPNRGVAATDYDKLQPGDLVFFDTESADAFRTDHSGIYLGVDDAGHHRFLSSRSKANGPTFGDMGGAAMLDGGGYWSIRFRTARRL